MNYKTISEMQYISIIHDQPHNYHTVLISKKHIYVHTHIHTCILLQYNFELHTFMLFSL